MRRLFVLALSLTILVPLLAVLLALSAASSQAQCGDGAVGPGSAPGVPSNLLAIYEQAAGNYQLGPSGWAYLAAINEIETDFGHDLSPSTAGAIGWMQFEPSTWARYQVSADPAKPGAPPDTYDPWDAIFTAARYLKASGAPGDWPTALYAYNHAGWYVAQTGQLAQHYAQTADSTVPATGMVPEPGCVTAGPTTPGPAAQILPDGLAAVPQGAPAQVQAAIAAGNRIIDTSYSTERHPNMLSTVMGSYDCSGSTDFVLYNAGLNSPQVDVGNGIAGDSTLLESYGDPSPGQWITVYASANHAFIQIAGIVLDTAHWTPTTPPGSGPRWQPASTLPSQLADGNTWTQRHPPRL
jgi:Transglycosylase SLT domain